MRLSNTVRDAFVRAAMDDVPTVEYDEEIRVKALKLAVAALPTKVKAVWNDPELRPFICMHHCTVGSGMPYEYRVGVTLPLGDAAAAKPILESLRPLVEKRQTEAEARQALRQKLKAVAYGQQTRAGLVTALPEFEKYLPADESAAIRSLPAIANVVSEFVKAGWPTKKPAAVAARKAKA